MKFKKTNHNAIKPLFCLILIILFCTNSALAWDGHRKGFILGVGIGPTHTSQEMKTETTDLSSEVTSYEYDESGVGLQYSLKIGYAPTEQIQIYALGKDIMFDKAYYTQIYGLTGLGFSYYFNKLPPSIYLTADVAFPIWNSSWFPPDFSDEETKSRIALNGGIGNEFARHWSVEFNLTWANLAREYYPDMEHEAQSDIDYFSFGLTINALGY